MNLKMLLPTTARGRDRLHWLIPVVVALVVLSASTKMANDILAGAIAIALFLVLVRRPTVALIALIVFLPLEPILFGLLLGAHVPASILRPAGGLKELMALSVLAAGIWEIHQGRQKLDKLDGVLLAYVAVVTLFVILPAIGQFSFPLNVRLLSWRADAGYPLVFFGARHAPIRAAAKEWVMRAILAMGLLTALVAMYQRLFTNSWTNFVFNTAHVADYYLKVLGLPVPTIQDDLRYLFVTNPLHVSSIFLSPYDMSDYLVLVLAIAAVRITHNYRNLFNYLVGGFAIAAIFFSRSRSDAVAAIVVLVLVVLPTSRQTTEGRLRLVVGLVLAALVIVPALPGSRYVGAQGGNVSATGHISEVDQGIRAIYYYPLGIGLGAQAGSYSRYFPAGSAGSHINGSDITDNAETQVGDELGIEALLPWLAMIALILLALRRKASGDNDQFAAAMGFGLLGVLVAGQLHQPFLTFPVPWTLWGAAGLSLSVYRPDQPERETPVLSDQHSGVR